jgi:AraC-like DNA-binding protein
MTDTGDIQAMLRGMRLSGAVFLEATFTAPWCVNSKVTPEECAPYAMPVPRQIIGYHYVASGQMLLKVAGQPPVTIHAGEIVVLPRNDPHVIGSALTLKPVDADEWVTFDPNGLLRLEMGGGGAPTTILCGFLGDDMPYNPVLAMLPAVLKQNVVEGAAGRWVESSFRQAATELLEGKGGSPVLLGRLAEMLFLEAVRRHLAQQPPDGAWTAGLQDHAVARALGLLHGQMARRWTTGDLADEIGLSRSAFADRFSRIVGEPPMRYLARHRLATASLLLKDSAASIASIAYEVGYESEAAFSRAFRRAYGAPPATWRQEQNLD